MRSLLYKFMDLNGFLVLKNSTDYVEVALKQIEDDLLTVLKELQETTLVMTSGKLPSAQELERYQQAIEWSKRVIALAERDK